MVPTPVEFNLCFFVMGVSDTKDEPQPHIFAFCYLRRLIMYHSIIVQ